MPCLQQEHKSAKQLVRFSLIIQQLTGFPLTPAAANITLCPTPATVSGDCVASASSESSVGTHRSVADVEWEQLAEHSHSCVRQLVVKPVSLTGSHKASVRLQLSSPTPTKPKILLAGTSCRLEAYKEQTRRSILHTSYQL